MAQDQIDIQLSKAEALTLLNVLIRYRDEDKLTVEGEADQQILYDLCGLVQNQVGHELLGSNWAERLSRAQAAVVAGNA